MLPLLIGRFRAGRDAEMRFTPGGVAVCDFSIIANAAKRDEQGEWQTVAETPWIKVTCWRKQAERAAEEVVQGCEVEVTGRLKVRKWETNEGEERQSIELDCISFEVIQRREDRQRSQGGSNAQGSQQSNDPWGSQQSNDPWAGPPSDPDEPPF